MKTKQLLFGIGLIIAASTTPLIAQNSGSGDLPTNKESFDQGTNVINLGVGIGGYYSFGGLGVSASPNIIASYEHGTFGNVGPGTISLGGLISYKSFSYDNTYSYYYGNPYYYDQKWTYYILGFRGAYHWNFTNEPKLDFYAGLMLAYDFAHYSFTTNDPYINSGYDPYYSVYNTTYGSYISLSGYVGMRYYFTHNFGLWAELGYGYTTLAIGVSIKF